MAKRLILNGRVQGVFCRAYCSQYARKHRIRGTASNLTEGTVRVLLATDDTELVNRYIADLKGNPNEFTFYGRIDTVDVYDYSGTIDGDYQF
ncbi:MAG: acylphosphatase [Spirochaetes bacterium]|nr:acylphosphatase [Spirochaetota bacterium]